jgi:hypothetical protein
MPVPSPGRWLPAVDIILALTITVGWRSRLQKFGLDSLKTQKLSALELEFAKEKLTALAIAGKQLQISIAKYRRSISQDGTTSDERDRLLARLAANIQALIVQRELIGLTHNNIQWVVQAYDVPTEALAKLGVVQPPVDRAP